MLASASEDLKMWRYRPRPCFSFQRCQAQTPPKSPSQLKCRLGVYRVRVQGYEESTGIMGLPTKDV